MKLAIIVYRQVWIDRIFWLGKIEKTGPLVIEYNMNIYIL